MKTRFTAPAAALVVGFTARLLCGFVFTSWHASDAADYMEQGHAILTGRWISWHANGYPVIAALVEATVGRRHLETALLLLNIVFSTAIVGCVGALARRLDPRPAAVAAAMWAAALWPNQVNEAQNVGSDIPAAFFLVLAIVLLGGNRQSARRHVRAGLAAGAAAACRLAVSPALAAMAVVLASRRSARSAMAFAAGAIVPLALIACLSAARGGGWNNEKDLGVVLLEADSSYGGAIVAPAEDATVAEGAAVYLRRLRREPWYFLRQRGAALWELWGSWPSDNGRGVARQLAVALRFPLLAMAVAGWWRLRGNPIATCLAASIAALTVGQMMLFALVRYLVPMEPLAIALAACACPSFRFLDP